MVRWALAFLWLRPCPCLGSDGLRIPLKEIAQGVAMPVISIGTGGLESRSSSEIVGSWLELGARGIDTAWVYRDQRVVAGAIAGAHVARRDVFITTKVPGCSSTRAFVEADLQQLGTDYIDLMLLHFPDRHNCTEAWEVLQDYHAKGVLRAIGVSNFKRGDLEPILKVAKVKPAVNQIQHNVLSHDDATVDFCQANDITVEAYSPLGRAGHSGDIPGNKQIQAIASTQNVSTYQVAVRWIVQHGHVLTFQSTSAEHQQEDADVFGFSLSGEEMAVLDGLQLRPAHYEVILA